MSLNSLNSKIVSSLGVPLSKIRPLNTTITSAPPTASSMVMGVDVASMYPSSTSSYNSGGNLNFGSLIDVPYLVSKDFPFKIKVISKSDIKTIQNSFSDMIDLMSKYDGYGSRLEAEKQRIKKLIDATVDISIVKELEKSLENIEVDHPEWLI